MKFFGWGKSKDPQPQTVLQQSNKTDPRNSSHGWDRGMPMGHTMPSKSTGSSGCTRKQQGLFGVDDDGYIHGGASSPVKHKQNGSDSGCDAKLQDTIRFVFSHEQEGLLAIGTFALEQLGAIRDTIDKHLKQADGGLDSRKDLDTYESFTCVMQSSDDEDEFPRSLHSKCELPVYGSDFSASESEAERASNEDSNGLKPSYNQSKALTLYKGSGNRSPVTGTKPIVLLTALPPELRKSLDPASPWVLQHSQLPTYVPLGHWTDSAAPPPVPLPRANADQEYYASYFCGLFGSKRKPRSRTRSDKSKRIVPIDIEDHKTLAIKPFDGLQAKKSPMPSFRSNGVPSLQKLSKLWRSSCRQSSARIAPERSPRASHDFQDAPTTGNGTTSGEVLAPPGTPPLVTRLLSRLPKDECSPEVAEFRRRVAIHERTLGANAPGEELRRDGVRSSRGDLNGAGGDLNRAGDRGHWIKTNSEYVVLEM